MNRPLPPFHLSAHGEERLKERQGMSSDTFHALIERQAFLFLDEVSTHQDRPVILIYHPRRKKTFKAILNSQGIVVTILPKPGTTEETKMVRALYEGSK
jgi:hypothetical protein